MTEQRKAIVIGATSGIGWEIVKLLSERNYTIGVAGRRQEKLDQLKDEVSGVVATQRIDVNAAGADKLLKDLIQQTGGMDVYIHCSGIGYQNLPLDSVKELATVETNALGFTRMIDAAFHYFEDENSGKGHIVAISSIAGVKGLGAAPAYSATKRFQNTYLEALSQLSRMRKDKIVVTDIRPGFVATDLLQGENYPMLMNKTDVARHIIQAIEHRRSIKIIDWKYRILVFFWRLLPHSLWVRLNIRTQKI